MFDVLVFRAPMDGLVNLGATGTVSGTLALVCQVNLLTTEYMKKRKNAKLALVQ